MPQTGSSGAEQAAGAAAPLTGKSRDKWLPNAPDWCNRDGTSNRSRRPPDWIIQGKVAADALDWIIRGRTRTIGHNPKD